ncbi:MAG: OmpA family protein [Thiotrichales bacterium]|nr:OmpA family protein [Thiotrichales bacterium]MCY4286796.1 OmpA family protein [Thiotrichales bacterium]MCY4350725.1 OmpA family protein [Thiotrichales bacterium]
MAITGLRRRHAEEEGESVFVSMTDLTVSFLFILLVLLAFFATQVRPDQPEKTVPLSKHEALEREFETERKERQVLADRLTEANAAKHRLEVALSNERRRTDILKADLARATATIDTLSAEVAQPPDPDPLAAYIKEGSETRARLLDSLAQRLRRSIPEIQITVRKREGVIRFHTDKLFDTGEWRIPKGSPAERVAHAIGEALAETLPCYTLSPIDVPCEGAVVAIETIQIEGHTDDVGLSQKLQQRENMLDNYDLSGRRGAETLRVMTRDRPDLELNKYLNLRGQPVLSFAGYGETRPINKENSDEARAQNRRIDIRFILQTPRNDLEVEQIRSQLTRRRADLPNVIDESRP